VQNCAAPLATRTRKGNISNTCTGFLYVSDHYKGSCFHTVKVLRETAAPYLSDLIENYISVRTLRSESYSLLRVQQSRESMRGKKSFRASAPRLWNELPNRIKLATSKDIFCTVLKTHLFKLAYL